MPDIQYLPHAAIDKTKWDACIATAATPCIYAYSYYLDAMALYWDALVLGDYIAVMPLTWNRKYGIYYLYQPPFTAVLGVLGRAVDAALVSAFLSAIPRKFRYCDIYLNAGNLFLLKGHPFYTRMNYVLSLRPSYPELRKQYRENLLRNIRKSKQVTGTVVRGIDPALVIGLAKQQPLPAGHPPEAAYTRIEKLYHQLYAMQKAITYGIVNTKEELLASAIFWISDKRAYYIVVGNHPDGKTIGASHALINAFIEDHAGQELVLDFEGSDVASLAFFYSSFGAVPETYPGYRFNRLPFWAKWLKR
jgi:hypothetical protein